MSALQWQTSASTGNSQGTQWSAAQHQGRCATKASLRCPNRLPLGNPSGSQACSPEANTCPPRVWKCPTKHLVLIFSEKYPGWSTTALLLMDFVYSQLPTSSSWSAPPSARCQQELEDVLLPEPLPTLPLDPPFGSLFPALRALPT